MDMRKAGVGITVAIGIAAILFVASFVYWGMYDTPDFSLMKKSIDVPIRLANGEDSLKKMGPQAPGWVPRSQISNFLADAVVASEDTAFFSHSGIDVHEIKEALKKDLKEGRFARGASTLTQQVLKNVFLGSDKSLWRKLREVILAPRLEKALTKTEILTFYLNMAEWGPGIYGCGEASRYYFGTTPANLTAKQAAFLTMLLPSPRRYHAYFRTRQLTQWANNRVNRILHIMNKMGDLDEAQLIAAQNEQLWGMPALADDAPGAPKDPGFVTESSDDSFDGGDLIQKAKTTAPVSPAAPAAPVAAESAKEPAAVAPNADPPNGGPEVTAPTTEPSFEDQ
jgi:monofunctional glycosyltransferase